jgi:uncharacterized membrane protein
MAEVTGGVEISIARELEQIMNAAYLHLAGTHLPVVGTLFGLGLFVYGLLRKSEELRRTGLLVFLVAALLAVPAYRTGAAAVSLLKRAAPGMPPDPTDQHAEVAILALTGSLVLGVVSLLGLICFRKGKRLPGAFLALVLLMAVVSSVLMTWTATLGGRIRHPEIRNSSINGTP